MVGHNSLSEMTRALPADASLALRLLEDAGFEAWVVGGWVRDQLLGLSSEDVDIATNATPEEIKQVFSKAACALVDQGERYGTIKVQILDTVQETCPNEPAATSIINSSSSSAYNDSEIEATIVSPTSLKRFSDRQFLDITTFRAEGFYSDKRHPKNVRFGQSIQEDLRRRDFTINAMAFHPNRGILDPFCGRKDIEQALIRTVGDSRARIQEDALRILRAVRFSCAFNFQLEASLKRTIEQEVHSLSSLSAERIGNELEKLVRTRWFSRALRQYKDVLCAAIPELAELDGYLQKTPYHNLDILQHTASVIDYLQIFAGIPDTPEQFRIPPELGFAALFHDIGKPSVMFLDPNPDSPKTMHFYNHPSVSEYIANRIMKRLGISRLIRQRASALIRFHDRQKERSALHVAQLLYGLHQHKAKDPYSLLYPLALLQEADAAAKAPQYRAGAIAAEIGYIFEKDLLHKNEQRDSLSREHPDCAFSRQKPLPIMAKELAFDGDDIKHHFYIESGPNVSRIQEALLKLIWCGAAKNTPGDLSLVTADAILCANLDRLKELLFPNPDDCIYFNYKDEPGPPYPGKIGIELERFVYDKNSGDRLYYNTGIRDFLEAWLKKFRCSKAVVEDDILLGAEGYAYGIRYTLTLEPGAQLEISLGPTDSLICLSEALGSFDGDIEHVFSDIGLNVELIASGVDHKNTTPSDTPLLPKERYKAMDAFLGRKGEQTRQMMRESASTQISIDFLEHRRLRQEFLLATVLSQYLYFLCDTTGSMTRLDIWNNVDNARCRIPRGLFVGESAQPTADKDEENLERMPALNLGLDKSSPEDAYLLWLLNTPCVYLKEHEQNKSFCNDKMGHKTVKEYLSSQLLMDEELLYASSFVFPDVRAKGYLEIRTPDAMPTQYALALAAFLKGLFYDKTSFFKSYALLVNGLEGSSPASIAPILKERGWNAIIANQKLPDIVNLLLKYAEEGLSSPDNTETLPDRDIVTRAEIGLLEPLKELWRQKKTINSISDL